MHQFKLTMLERKSVKGFPWLTLLGTIFAFMICVTASGMILIAYPQSSQLFQILFRENEEPLSFSSSHHIFSNEATPFQPLPTESLTSKPTIIPEPTPTESPKPAPSTQPATTPETLNESIPASSYISGIYGSPQLYTLDCESQAAVDWASYFDVRINEYEFIDHLPSSDDPEEGFVGNINGPMGKIPPDDYGVYPKPVAKILRAYGLNAQAVSGWDLNSLKREIAAGRPVIVWIVNLPFSVNPSEYTASNGNTTIVAPFQHTWIVTGYNSSTFTVVDSEWTYNVYTSTFVERWDALGNQAIIMNPK